MALQKPLILLGAGGHAKVLLDLMLEIESPILGLADPTQTQPLLGVEVRGDDSWVATHAPDSVLLVNGIGGVTVGPLREKIFSQWKARGYSFATLVHPSAVVGREVRLGEGVQVMAGAVIQAGTSVGANTVVNTRASIDHEGVIGAHVHIAPGVVLSGNVRVGDRAHLGTGALVIQGVTIGPKALVAAGAVVVKDVAEDVRVRGVPAQIFSKEE